MPLIRTIDARTLQCPLAILMVNRELKALSPGQAVRVMTDSSTLLHDIGLLVRNTPELTIKIETNEESHHSIIINRNKTEGGMYD